MASNDNTKASKRPQAQGPMGHGMGQPVVKAKDFKGTLRRLLGYLKPQMFALIMVFILAIIGTVFAIIAPKVLANATNALQIGIMNGMLDMEYIYKIIYIVVAMYLLSAIFSFLSFFISATMAQRVVYRMRSDIKNKLSKLPINYFDKNSTGNILSRITNDIETISMSLQQSLTQSITGVISIIGIIIMMLSISGWLTLVTLLTLPMYLFATMLIAKKSQLKFKAQQNKLGELNGYIEEVYGGRKVVKLYGREQESKSTFSVINNDLNNASKGAQFLAGLIMPLLRFISNIGYVGVCIVGGVLAGAKNPLLLGDIQAFIQYTNQFSQPIMQTANIANTIQSTIAASERVFEILDQSTEPEDIKEYQSIENITGTVEFKNVDFSYNEETELISNLNLKVESGGTIAIVGPTGAGKTTLVNLLLRFYEIKGGSIEIDSIDIRDFKKEDLRELFGMVLQDTWLESGTIKENIAYGRPDASIEDIEEAAKKAHVDHFVRTLRDGYDTILNEETTNISQGQKQLITIARAILKNPKILILDEATSSVDTMTESYIQNAMTNMMKGKTNFVIAHRLSTIRNANSIIVMDNGAIKEQGNHQELIAKRGFYYELYNSQFLNVEVAS